MRKVRGVGQISDRCRLQSVHYLIGPWYDGPKGGLFAGLKYMLA